MRKLTALIICACIAVSAAFAQTRQQALDEIARMEKIAAQLPEMLRQAWEAGITQTDTVIDTPYGKLTIKFNLDEIIKETYTGSSLAANLETWHGVQQGNEIRINNGGSWRNKTPEGMKRTITHELGHFMDRRPNEVKTSPSRYGPVGDFTEIEAEAFAMRYIGKSEYTAELKRGYLITQSYIDAIINRAEQMEREERETLARLRTIANAPPSAPPPPAQKPSVNPAQALADSAIAAFGRKEYDKTIADYTKAIQIDPNFATAYFNRASAYGMKSEYDKAIADYTKAIELNPGITGAYNNRGIAYLDKDDYDRAMADFNQQIRIAPYARTYTNRGITYYKKNDLDRAMADHNQAIRLDPNLAEAYSNRGLVYEAKSDHDMAIADYTQAIRLNSNYADAYHNRGKAYYEKGDYDMAIADYTQAIRINPNFAKTYGFRGMAYFQKKDLDRTIADFETALRLDPNDALAGSILDMVRHLKQIRQ
jgi:tetratricopeptide (TPR) repeat protein